MGEKILASIAILALFNLGLYARKIVFYRISNANRVNLYVNIFLVVALIIYIFFG